MCECGNGDEATTHGATEDFATTSVSGAGTGTTAARPSGDDAEEDANADAPATIAFCSSRTFSHVSIPFLTFSLFFNASRAEAQSCRHDVKEIPLSIPASFR